MSKIIRLGTCQDGDIFAKIELNSKKTPAELSISGVIGPKANGDARGSCGQFIMSFKEFDKRGHMTLADITPAPGWDTTKILRFLQIWDLYHLNDMQAGTPEQSAYLRQIKNEYPGYPTPHYDWACERLAAVGLNPHNGYKYGSAWLKTEVPKSVLDELDALPETDKQPAWV